MAERVTIEIRSVDRASAGIRRVSGAIRNMATIVGSLIAFRLFTRLASSIARAGRAAMVAYEWYDRIRYSLTELARAEILDSMDRLSLTTADFSKVLIQAKESAQELLNWTIKLALASPFTAEDVNKMFRLIRAYGFATVEAQSLTGQIMDFAAATGFGAQVLERLGLALGQVRQRGRLAGEEIRQLINVGIPVRDIVAKAFEVTTGELERMIRAGKVAADVALPAILEWMQRFDGASERAVKTWQGLVANMKDVKDLNMIAFFKGLAEVMHPALQGVFDIMSSEEFMATLERLGEQVGDFIGPMVEKLPKAIQTLGTMLGIFQAFSVGHITFGTMAAGFLEMIGKIDSSEIRSVKQLIDDLALSFQTWKQKLSDFADVWLGPIRDALPGWLISISEISFESFDAFAPMFERFGVSLKSISESVAPEAIQNLTDSLSNLSEWWASGAAVGAANLLEFLLTLASGGIAGGILILTAAIGAFTDVLVGKDPMPRLERMMEIFDKIAGTVAETPLMQEAASSVAMLFTPVPTAEGGVTTAGNEIAFEFLASLVGPLDANTEVAEATIAMLEGAGISATAWSTMTGEQQMALVGKNMAAGFGSGFAAEADVQIEIMEGKLQEIINLVNKMYEIESASKVFKRAGINLMKGLGVGIVKGTKGMMNDVVSSAQSVGSALTGGMQPATAMGPSLDQSRTSHITIQNMPINTGQDEDAMLNTLKRI